MHCVSHRTATPAIRGPRDDHKRQRSGITNVRACAKRKISESGDSRYQRSVEAMEETEALLPPLTRPLSFSRAPSVKSCSSDGRDEVSSHTNSPPVEQGRRSPLGESVSIKSASRVIDDTLVRRSTLARGKILPAKTIPPARRCELPSEPEKRRMGSGGRLIALPPRMIAGWGRE